MVIEGDQYVRSCRVVGGIFRLREESGEPPRWRYLDLSAWFARAFGKSHQAKLRRIEAAQNRAPVLKKLNKERMRLYGISADELTGRPLKTTDAQFCHIVAQSLEPEISDCLWNGVIVDRELHVRLTLAGVVTHEHLLDFCEANAMSTVWYEPFMAQYRSFFA